jgi:hypothetical protein
VDTTDRNDGPVNRASTSQNLELFAGDIGNVFGVKDVPDGDGVADACTSCPMVGVHCPCVIDEYAIEGTSRDGKKEVEEKEEATEKVKHKLPSFRSRNDIIQDRCWYAFVALWSKL